MSHIPGWTKEEVNLSPLSDTAGMRLRGERDLAMENVRKRASLGYCYELLPSLSSQQTSPLQSFPLYGQQSLSRFLWTCCLIHCPFPPVNTQLTEWGYIAWALHTDTLEAPVFFKQGLFALLCLHGRHWRDSGIEMSDQADCVFYWKYKDTFSHIPQPSFLHTFSFFLISARGVGSLYC